MMQHGDADREAVVKSDASDWAEAAIVSQVFGDGLLHLVVYHFCKFNEA